MLLHTLHVKPFLCLQTDSPAGQSCTTPGSCYYQPHRMYNHASSRSERRTINRGEGLLPVVHKTHSEPLLLLLSFCISSRYYLHRSSSLVSISLFFLSDTRAGVLPFHLCSRMQYTFSSPVCIAAVILP